ncbi:unnamed protein product, partial [Mesorhabditis belari]|uniref:Uncharacterized protein n=1 Tax=Mesorhabditis belari TaxID=2138241 RepID=A0AAF3J2Q6_9BILA
MRKPQGFETRFGRVTRSKMPFEMRKLTSFPMEKLCYDLKLEVFEQMEPNDAIELAKVDIGIAARVNNETKAHDDQNAVNLTPRRRAYPGYWSKKTIEEHNRRLEETEWERWSRLGMTIRVANSTTLRVCGDESPVDAMHEELKAGLRLEILDTVREIFVGRADKWKLTLQKQSDGGKQWKIPADVAIEKSDGRVITLWSPFKALSVFTIGCGKKMISLNARE